ncbi:MAG: phosphoribosylanthranilate isomerase [Rhizobiaceae bacterium]|nr:phosphoribosylanthranilate isomerase [Rhizobiaceae bacterium]
MNTPELIKICGLSTDEAIDAVIGEGATHMGLIFFEKSPRHVSIEKAAALSTHAGNRVQKVAVTVNADDLYLQQIVDAVGPDLLQLHGKESVERVDEVKSRFGLPVIKALAVSGAEDLEHAKIYIGKADYFLFDAKPPKGADLPGGNGVAFDWEIMDQWPADVPYILSGGLNLENINDAILHSGAMGIDLSSGVESSPGVKDTRLIREFLRMVTQKDECVE